jgi:outer membrane beta-barrel protein
MRKNQSGVELFVALALLLTPRALLAQDTDATTAEESGETEPTEATEPGSEPESEPTGAGSLEEICKIDPTQCTKIDMDQSAKRDLHPDMYAVQQIWALRTNRFEINPYFGMTMNDQFVAHPGFGVGLNYYMLHWLAFGVNGNAYAGLNSESDFNFQTSRAARIGQPITEYQWNVNGNVTVVPAYGKFAAFSNFIFHYDFYFLLGGGAVSTRPIAVVDPDNRTFAFGVKPTFGGAAGMRIFFTRYLAAMLEIRDYIFFEDLENPGIASGTDAQGVPLAQDPSTWLAPDKSFTNNVQAQLGLSVFLPFSWTYKTAK